MVINGKHINTSVGAKEIAVRNGREFKFLVLARFSPVIPKGGAALRNCQTIRALANLGDVDVVTVGDEVSAGEPVGDVRQWKGFSLSRLLRNKGLIYRGRKKVWRAIPGAIPIIDKYFQPEVVEYLVDRVQRERYDFAVIEELSLARYLPVLQSAGCRTIFDAHNIESVLRTKLAKVGRQGSKLHPLDRYLIDRRMLGLERKIIRRSDAVWVCSKVDADQIASFYGRSRSVFVIPNGVDVRAYRHNEDVAQEAESRGPIQLLYMGSYSYYPNEEAALCLIREVMPLVRAKGEEVRLTLVGRDPSSAMLQAAGGTGDVTITGSVESVLPYLQQSSLMVVPLTLGSGTRLKILEAFAAGCPVISSSKGAEGIECIDERHLLIRESPESMAKAAIELWKNTGKMRSIQKNALELVSRKYSWNSAAEKIKNSLHLKEC